MSERRPRREAPAVVRRERRRAPAEAPAEPVVLWDRNSWRHLLAFLVVVGAVAGAGLLAQKAVETRATGALAGCHTARQLGPRTYLAPPKMCIDRNRTYLADVVTNRGKFTLSLQPKNDPVTVNNFVVLASNGYYDGLSIWHVDTWYLQGGDPLDNGHGGPGYTLPDEPSNAGWGTGVVAMARNPNGPVNGSQFMILKDRWPGGSPAGGLTFNQFGTVKSGLSVVDSLTAGDRIISISVRPA